MLLRLEQNGQEKGKLPPSFHYIEQFTWSEATKELILGTEPSPVN